MLERLEINFSKVSSEIFFFKFSFSHSMRPPTSISKWRESRMEVLDMSDDISSKKLILQHPLPGFDEESKEKEPVLEADRPTVLTSILAKLDNDSNALGTPERTPPTSLSIPVGVELSVTTYSNLAELLGS